MRCQEKFLYPERDRTEKGNVAKNGRILMANLFYSSKADVSAQNFPDSPDLVVKSQVIDIAKIILGHNR
jgi:hypothetical protein